MRIRNVVLMGACLTISMSDSSRSVGEITHVIRTGATVPVPLVFSREGRCVLWLGELAWQSELFSLAEHYEAYTQCYYRVDGESFKVRSHVTLAADRATVAVGQHRLRVGGGELPAPWKKPGTSVHYLWRRVLDLDVLLRGPVPRWRAEHLQMLLSKADADAPLGAKFQVKRGPFPSVEFENCTEEIVHYFDQAVRAVGHRRQVINVLGGLVGDYTAHYFRREEYPGPPKDFLADFNREFVPNDRSSPPAEGPVTELRDLPGFATSLKRALKGSPDAIRGRPAVPIHLGASEAELRADKPRLLRLLIGDRPVVPGAERCPTTRRVGSVSRAAGPSPVPPENVIRAELDDGSMSRCAEPIGPAGENEGAIGCWGASADRPSG